MVIGLCSAALFAQVAPDVNNPNTLLKLRKELIDAVPVGTRFEDVTKYLDRWAVSYNVVEDAITMNPEKMKQEHLQLAIFAIMTAEPVKGERFLSVETKAFFQFKDRNLLDIYVSQLVAAP